MVIPSQAAFKKKKNKNMVSSHNKNVFRYTAMEIFLAMHILAQLQLAVLMSCLGMCLV